MPTIRNRRNSLYGYPNPQAGLQQEPIVQRRAPTAADTAELGTIWIDTSANSFYILTNVTGPTNTWTSTTGGATTLASLEVDPGDAVVTAGNLEVTAGDFTATAGTATVGTFVAGATTIVGATGITGNTVINGDLDVTGNTTFTGDVDITDTASISLTSTNNAAGAITLLANGGVNETIVIQSAQGTGNSAVGLHAVAGGVTIRSDAVSANAVNLYASDAASGITAVCGTDGFAIGIINGAFTVWTGTGAVDIGTDAVAHDIALGNSTGATSITLDTGTGALNIGANAIAHAIAIGNNTGATSVDINAGTAGAGSINIGTAAHDTPITIGNVTGVSTVTINSGTGGCGINTTGAGSFIVNSANVFALDSTATSSLTVTGGGADLQLASVGGSVAIDSSEASATAISLTTSDAAGGMVFSYGSGGTVFAGGNGAFEVTTGTGAINIGTDVAAHTITLGNSTGATSVVIDAGTGALNIGTNAIAHAIAIGNSTGATSVDINAGTAGAGAINIGTAAHEVPVTIGNITDATAVVINTGTGGFQLNTTGVGTIDINATNAFEIDAAAASHITVTGAGLDLAMGSLGGSVIISSSEAVVNAILLSATDAAGGIVLNSPGNVGVTTAIDTQASPSAASTLNFRVLRVIFTGFTTAAAATQDFTITSDKILTTSGILVQVTNLDASTNGAIMTLTGVTQAAGSIVVHTTNNGPDALGAGDNVIITVWVLS